MSKTFAEQLEEDRRLALLRVLGEQPSHSMNSSNLDKWLRHIQITGTRAETMASLRWLADQALIQLRPLPDIDGLYVAELTGAGDDIASGRAAHPGVARPSRR